MPKTAKKPPGAGGHCKNCYAHVDEFTGMCRDITCPYSKRLQSARVKKGTRLPVSGKIVEMRSVTDRSMQVILENGVSAWISFNDDSIHMSFSGYEYEKGLSIREAELIGKPFPLSNTVTINYTRKPK